MVEERGGFSKAATGLKFTFADIGGQFLDRAVHFHSSVLDSSPAHIQSFGLSPLNELDRIGKNLENALYGTARRSYRRNPRKPRKIFWRRRQDAVTKPADGSGPD